MQAEQGWRILTNLDSLVVGVLKAKYFLDGIFFEGSSRVNFLLYLKNHHGGQSCAKHGTPLEDWGWLDF